MNDEGRNACVTNFVREGLCLSLAHPSQQTQTGAEPLSNKLSANVRSANAGCGKACCKRQGTAGAKTEEHDATKQQSPQGKLKLQFSAHSTYPVAAADISQPTGDL